MQKRPSLNAGAPKPIHSGSSGSSTAGSSAARLSASFGAGSSSSTGGSRSRSRSTSRPGSRPESATAKRTGSVVRSTGIAAPPPAVHPLPPSAYGTPPVAAAASRVSQAMNATANTNPRLSSSAAPSASSGLSTSIRRADPSPPPVHRSSAIQPTGRTSVSSSLATNPTSAAIRSVNQTTKFNAGAGPIKSGATASTAGSMPLRALPISSAGSSVNGSTTAVTRASLISSTASSGSTGGGTPGRRASGGVPLVPSAPLTPNPNTAATSTAAPITASSLLASFDSVSAARRTAKAAAATATTPTNAAAAADDRFRSSLGGVSGGSSGERDRFKPQQPVVGTAQPAGLQQTKPEPKLQSGASASTPTERERASAAMNASFNSSMTGYRSGLSSLPSLSSNDESKQYLTLDTEVYRSLPAGFGAPSPTAATASAATGFMNLESTSAYATYNSRMSGSGRDSQSNLALNSVSAKQSSPPQVAGSAKPAVATAAPATQTASKSFGTNGPAADEKTFDTTMSSVGGGGDGSEDPYALFGIKRTKHVVTRALTGLDNLGNTCFMNSILQCLGSTVPLMDYFTSNKIVYNTTKAKTKGRFAQEFAALAVGMRTARDHSTLRPSAVKKYVAFLNPSFEGYGQQDAQELLRVLLDALHDDINRITKPPPYTSIVDGATDSAQTKSERWWKHHKARQDSFLNTLFGGQLQSTITCLTCKHSSCAFDPFWDLSLPIPKTAASSSSSYSSSSPYSSSFSSRYGLSSYSSYSPYSSRYGGGSSDYGGSVTLAECLKAFTEEETLSGNEQVYCSACKTHRDQTKRLAIFRFPSILVLHLKRFSSSASASSSRYSYLLSSIGGSSKVYTDVKFPLTLDLSDYRPAGTGSGESLVYSLYAVSNHMGSMGGGHYTAHCKVKQTSDDSGWYTFDDSYVSSTSADRIGGANAYILFYERVPANANASAAAVGTGSASAKRSAL